MSKRNSIDMDKNSESRRLCGGPTLPAADVDYFEQEMLRVAAAEGMADCSFPTLLRRIARAELDLTLVGIARYMAIDEKRKTIRSRSRKRSGLRPATNSLASNPG
jgi:hypothetical protein